MFLSDFVFSRVVTKDEEDFDKFLESVKAKQLSLTTKGVCTVYVRASFDSYVLWLLGQQPSYSVPYIVYVFKL